jgi:hypothetical protein
VGFVFIFRFSGEPPQCFFEFFEGPHSQAAHSAEESEILNAAVNIGLVKNRQALLPGEAGFLKGPNQRRQFCLGEPWLWQHREPPQVQQSVVESAFPARQRQGPERLLARFEIEVLVGVQADEFARSNDVQFYRHGSPRLAEGFAVGEESVWPKQKVAPATAMRREREQIFMKMFAVELAGLHSAGSFH